MLGFWLVFGWVGWLGFFLRFYSIIIILLESGFGREKKISPHFVVLWKLLLSTCFVEMPLSLTFKFPQNSTFGELPSLDWLSEPVLVQREELDLLAGPVCIPVGAGMLQVPGKVWTLGSPGLGF